MSSLSVHAALEVRQDNNAILLSETASTKLPIPVLGLDGRIAITDRIIATGRAAILPRVNFSDYSGEAWVGNFSIEYRPFQRVGLGIGYHYFNLNGTVEKTDFHADVDMTVSGAEAFIHFVFGAR